jgi:ABC-type antimicrobial peptide transport system permease subunit
MDEWVDREAASRRFLLALLAAFALLAAALAVIGIYGVGAYLVSRRVREIGIRLALGARRRSVALLVLGTHAPWIAGGLAAGGVAAWGLTRVLTTYLYGVEPGDPATLVLVAAGLAAAALAAQAVPMRRATRVDPATALRADS